WPYPSGQWVQEYERMAELERQLPDLLEGKSTPASPAGWMELAKLCTRKSLYRGAVRCYEGAFAAPRVADDLAAGHRYDAACAAALAACGQGKDAADPEDKGRASMRQKALGWLRADLALRTKQLESGKPADRKEAQGLLQAWLQDPDFAGLRGAEALGRLPE